MVPLMSCAMMLCSSDEYNGVGLGYILKDPRWCCAAALDAAPTQMDVIIYAPADCLLVREATSRLSGRGRDMIGGLASVFRSRQANGGNIHSFCLQPVSFVSIRTRLLS